MTILMKIIGTLLLVGVALCILFGSSVNKKDEIDNVPNVLAAIGGLSIILGFILGIIGALTMIWETQ